MLPWTRTHLNLPMESSEIEIPFKARYYTLGPGITQARQTWFVLHGYGQLAQYFIRHFKILEDHNIRVIAPEALSRFYLQDVASRTRSGNDRVGATWMTRENRQTDIHNYLTFLNSLYRHEVGNGVAPVTILGFSQGAATASRWALDGKVAFDKLVLWAGILPPDMDFQTGKTRLAGKPVTLVYGKQDPYLTDDRFAEMNMFSQKLGIQPQTLAFDGGHEINTTALQQLL